jgi:hypothetical protein
MLCLPSGTFETARVRDIGRNLRKDVTWPDGCTYIWCEIQHIGFIIYPHLFPKLKRFCTPSIHSQDEWPTLHRAA